MKIKFINGLVCCAVVGLFITFGGSNHKEFVAEIDIEKRALERVKEMYPNAKIYDPTSFVGEVKDSRYSHDREFKPKPNIDYRAGKFVFNWDYKNEKQTSRDYIEYYYVAFVVEKNDGKFYHVEVGCPFKGGECISADLINHKNDRMNALMYGETNIEQELKFYTDDEKAKLRKDMNL